MGGRPDLWHRLEKVRAIVAELEKKKSSWTNSNSSGETGQRPEILFQCGDAGPPVGSADQPASKGSRNFELIMASNKPACCGDATVNVERFDRGLFGANEDCAIC